MYYLTRYASGNIYIECGNENKAEVTAVVRIATRDGCMDIGNSGPIIGCAKILFSSESEEEVLGYAALGEL